VPLTVAQAKTNTTLMPLASSAVYYGTSLTFTATVQGAGGVPPSDGTVTFTITPQGGAPQTSQPVPVGTSGQASYTPPALLGAGSYTVTATYNGDPDGDDDFLSSPPSQPLSLTVKLDDTQVTVGTSPDNDPSVYGESLQFTATVTATEENVTPVGSVTFTFTPDDGGTTVPPNTAVVNDDGVATTKNVNLAVGTYTITATYVPLPGNTDFKAPPTPPTYVQVVNPDVTFTTLNSSGSPSIYGQSIKFTATVIASPPGNGTPTGTVTFYDGPIQLGSAKLDNKTGPDIASISTNKLTFGIYEMTATYSSDSGNFYSSSTSPPGLQQIVNPAPVKTVVTASPSQADYGQQVMLTATVSSTAGTPTGYVAFLVNGIPYANATLTHGKAMLETKKPLPVGMDNIQAENGGNPNYGIGLSESVKEVVNLAATTTKVSVGSGTSVYGQAVTFTATVKATSPDGGTPTESVTFTVTPPTGAPVVTTAALNAKGQATLPFGSPAVGKYTITASYGGSVDYKASTATAVTQVKQDGSTTSVTSSDNPSIVGVAVKFTATVNAASPGSGTPTGAVSFYYGNTLLDTDPIPLTNGTATLTTSSLPVGTDKIKVVYSGDTNFKESKSDVLDQTVIGAVAGVVVGPSTGQADDPGVPMALGMIDAAIEALNGEPGDNAIPPHKTNRAVPARPVAIDRRIQ
jgi:large repetitive protein